jgi:hypothetical protein
LLLLFLLILGTTGQANLLEDIARTNGRPHPNHFFRHGAWQILRILAVNIVAKGIMIALFLFMAFLFATLTSDDPMTNFLTSTAVLLVFFPLTLLVSYLWMMTLIEVVLKNKTVIQGTQDAFRLLQNHWLPVTELAAFLFFLQLLFNLFFLISALLFVVPSTLLFSASLTSNLPLLSAAIQGLEGFGLTILLLLFLGFFTSVAYASWFELQKKMGGRAPLFSPVQRLFSRVFDP